MSSLLKYFLDLEFENSINKLKNEVSIDKTSIASLQTQVSANQTSISNLQTAQASNTASINSNIASINALQTRASTNETNITSLQNSTTALTSRSDLNQTFSRATRNQLIPTRPNDATLMSSFTNPVIDNQSWTCFDYSPSLNLFVALADSNGALPTGRRVATSRDGLTWTVRDVGTGMDRGWQSICWSEELKIFVAVGFLGSFGKSSDGINWTVQTFGSRNWRSVIWSRRYNRFVAVASSSTAGYSNDGITWVTTSPGSGDWTKVSSNETDGVIIAVMGGQVGVQLNRVTRSLDGGLTWSQPDLQNTFINSIPVFGNPFGAVNYINSSIGWLAGAVRGSSNNQRILRSIDNGLTWTSATSVPVVTEATKFVFSEFYNSLILASGGTDTAANGSKILMSRDGLTWTVLTQTGSVATVYRDLLCMDNFGFFMAIASSGTLNSNEIRLTRSRVPTYSSLIY